jgi:methyl-accepting chemotaxis protein
VSHSDVAGGGLKIGWYGHTINAIRSIFFPFTRECALFQRLFADGEFRADNWLIVTVVGLVFFLVQLALTLRFNRRLRRQRRILARLAANYEKFGDGRGNVEALHESYGWIHWVVANFPARSTNPPANYSREDVLQELDTRIASDSDYLLLQRMGIMAPLLGVVLTVVGFYFLEINDSQEQSLQSILLAVTPLVAGVGTGAVLALINQVLLHVAGRRVEALRMAAREWFDAVVWRHIGLDTQAATVKAVRAIEQLATSVTQSATRHDESSSHIAQTSASIKDAATQFGQVVNSFAGEIRGIPESLSDVRRSTSAAAASLDELIQIGTRAVANLDVSVAAFRTSLDRDFATAAQLHYRSGKMLSESARQISEAAELLKSGADDMKQTTQAGAASFETLDESIRQQVVPANRRFSEAVQELSGQASTVGKAARELSSHVVATASELDKAAGRLVPSFSSICDAVDQQLGPAVVQQTKQVESISQSIERLREVAESMSDGMRGLRATLDEFSLAVGRAGPLQETLAGTANDLVEAGKNLRRSIEGDMAPSQRTLRDSAATFANASRQLSDFTQEGLAPATRELVTLHDTLRGLEEVVASIREFSRARPDIDRLNAALARSAEISDALAALPERLREILEQSTNHSEGLTNLPDRVRTWLTRRPR